MREQGAFFFGGEGYNIHEKTSEKLQNDDSPGYLEKMMIHPEE